MTWVNLITEHPS